MHRAQDGGPVVDSSLSVEAQRSPASRGRCGALTTEFSGLDRWQRRPQSFASMVSPLKMLLSLVLELPESGREAAPSKPRPECSPHPSTVRFGSP